MSSIGRINQTERAIYTDSLVGHDNIDLRSEYVFHKACQDQANAILLSEDRCGQFFRENRIQLVIATSALFVALLIPCLGAAGILTLTGTSWIIAKVVNAVATMTFFVLATELSDGSAPRRRHCTCSMAQKSISHRFSLFSPIRPNRTH